MKNGLSSGLLSLAFHRCFSYMVMDEVGMSIPAGICGIFLEDSKTPSLGLRILMALGLRETINRQKRVGSQLNETCQILFLGGRTMCLGHTQQCSKNSLDSELSDDLWECWYVGGQYGVPEMKPGSLGCWASTFT